MFEQGQFVLGATQSMWFVAAITAAAALYVLWTYQQLTALRGRDKVVLSVTRVALLAVALFAVLRPMLLLKVAVPQQNFVGVVLDDSRSMQVADEADQARSQYVLDQFGKPDTPLMRSLGERLVTRVFRFSSAAERLPRSIPIIPVRDRYQPKSGSQSNSRFRMKLGRGKSSISRSVSQAD